MDSFSNSLIISRSVQEILEVSGHVVHVTFRVLRRFEGSVDVKEPPLGFPGTQGNACSAGFCPSLGLRQLDWGAVGLKDDAMSRRPRVHKDVFVTIGVDLDGLHRIQPRRPSILPGLWGMDHNKGAPKWFWKPSANAPSAQLKPPHHKPLGPWGAMARLNGIP